MTIQDQQRHSGGISSMWLLFDVVCQMMLTLVAAQRGFLSLDCGGEHSFEDDSGIRWIPDTEYISSGIASTVSSEYFNHVDRQYQTLRYFDALKKHCYSLPVGAYQTYLLRPSFFYGNYDGLSKTFIEFDAMVGVNDFPVSFSGVSDEMTFRYWFWYREFIVTIGNFTKVDFCVGSSDTTTVPFISALELRPLENDMYNASEDAIFEKLYRLNLGANSSDIRYPVDEYDRIWKASSQYAKYARYESISTSSTVDVTDRIRDRVPPQVLRTAITFTGDMRFDFPNAIANGESHIYNLVFYFAELNTTPGGSRVFNLTFDSQIGTINLTKFNPYELYSYPATFEGSTAFTFAPVEGSTWGPILNAVELFEHFTRAAGTDANDVEAIQDLKAKLNFTSWSGDPCFPLAFQWDWIICERATIVGLNLSYRQLGGFMPESIKKLVNLEKIYLDHNSLEGPVPNFLSSLQHLKTLHLESNKLSGTFPEKLPPQLEDLSLDNNPLLCVPENVREKFNLNLTSVSTSCGQSTQGHRKVIIGVTVPIAVLLLVLAVALYKFRLRRKTKRSSGTQIGEVQNKRPHLPLKSPPNITTNAARFTYGEICQATSSFKNKLGEGSFGAVYHGRLASGEEVAVKVLSESSSQGLQEFNSEAEVLSTVHHRNVVTFIGYCTHELKMILVYEFLANGTLRDHLCGSNVRPLPWITRLKVALDAAQGLEYLHFMCNLAIIHRDVKSTNILLSSTMVAKVTDFGLSKSFQKESGETHISTLVKGTPGYLDPEYHSYNRLTHKSDVYSFGVVLFEIICGREPVKLSLPDEQVSLVKWAWNELGRGNLKKIMDPNMDDYSEQAAWKVAEVAISCTEYDSVNRPDMRMVVRELREAIQLCEL